VLLDEKYYRAHLKLKHGNKQQAQCDACGLKLAHKHTLRRHFEAKHLK
jgi:hypothetical protein